MAKYRVDFKGWAVIEAENVDEARELFINNECVENITDEDWEEVE